MTTDRRIIEVVDDTVEGIIYRCAGCGATDKPTEGPEAA